MLAEELAKLYGVEVKVLNQAVRRNAERFPADFMFPLSWEESERSRSQFVTLNEANGKRRVRGQNIKYRPLAFMRAFVRLRGMVADSAELARRLDVLESKYDREFRVVFDAIRELMAPPQPGPKRRIGFVSEGSRASYQPVGPD